jgi:hypothetical protein
VSGDAIIHAQRAVDLMRKAILRSVAGQHGKALGALHAARGELVLAEGWFRTSTGQTGLDAYVFEAAAIANSKRELDARFRRLRENVAEESPHLFANSTDFLFSGANAAEHFVHYLQGREGEYLARRL